MAPLRLKATAATLTLLTALLFTTAPVLAAETRPQGIAPRPPSATGVVVNIPARTLYWYRDGAVEGVFPVGVGKDSTQTPVGSYRVQNKAVHPWWLPPNGGPAVAPGPANPLGTRWIGFSGGYGIHGNNNPASIGGLVSLGCVRMYIPDVEWLYQQVSVGTPVHVTYESVQMQYGAGGQRYLAIHPDVYGWGRPGVASVLTAAGIEPDAVVASEPGLYPLDAVAQQNGRTLPAILHQGRPYIQARALGGRLRADVVWDAASGTVLLGGNPLPTVVRGGTGYVDAADAAATLGVDYAWNSQTRTAVFTGRPVFMGGHLLTRRGLTIDSLAYLPVRAVGEAAGYGVGWDGESRRALIDGVALETVLVGSKAYTPADLVAVRLGLQIRLVDETIELEG